MAHNVFRGPSRGCTSSTLGPRPPPVLPPHFALGGSRGTLIGPFLASLDDLEALLWPNFRVISAPGDPGPLSELGLLAGMSLQTIRKTWGLERIQDLDDEMAEAHLASALIYPLEISTPGSSRLDWPGPPMSCWSRQGTSHTGDQNTHGSFRSTQLAMDHLATSCLWATSTSLINLFSN